MKQTFLPLSNPSYGPSGHGKGLVDAMSAFSIKGPLLKAVITDNFKYNSAKTFINI